jgi:tubulin gamma
LFKRIVAQYDRLRKRNAFLDQYKKEPMFSQDLGEFDDTRAVVSDLIAEYEAAEGAGYLSPPAPIEKSADRRDPGYERGEPAE